MCGSASFIEGVAKGTEHIRIMPKAPKAGPIRERDVAATVASIILALKGTQPRIAAAQPEFTGENQQRRPSHLQRPRGANESAVPR